MSAPRVGVVVPRLCEPGHGADCAGKSINSFQPGFPLKCDAIVNRKELKEKLAAISRTEDRLCAKDEALEGRRSQLEQRETGLKEFNRALDEQQAKDFGRPFAFFMRDRSSSSTLACVNSVLCYGSRKFEYLQPGA